jgi:ATP-binding cassette subfamily B protein
MIAPDNFISAAEPAAVPDFIAEALERDGAQTCDVLTAVRSDLLPDGSFGEEWLLVLAGRILVYSQEADGRWRRRQDLPLDAGRSARIEPITCGGELLVDGGGMPRRVLAFSAACMAEMAAALSAIAALAERRAVDSAALPPPTRGGRCVRCGRAMEPGSQICPHCSGKGRVLWRLVRLAAPYRRSVAAIVALLLVGVGLGLIPPYLVRTLVDTVLTERARPDWLMPILAAIFGIYALHAAVNMLHGRLAVRVGSRLTTDLRRRLFSHLSWLSVSFFDRMQVGQLMTRVAQDTEELHVFVSQALGGFLVPLVTALGITAMLFWLNPVLAVYVLTPLPLVMLSTWLFWRTVTPRHERYWKTRARVNAFLSTCFSGIRVVKAFGQERREQERFGLHNESLRGARVGVDQIWAVYFPGVILAFQASGLLVWYFGGRRVLGGEVTLGTLMAFLGYLGMLHGPLSVLSQVGQWLTRSLTSAQRLFEMLDQRPEVTEAQPAHRTGALRGEIEFRNVTFGYLPSRPVLRGLSFRIKPGEVVGVVGRSGAGKTTLAGLIARFYDPQQGQVLLDGRDVRDMAAEDLRRNVGLVLQDPFIFRGPVAENIGYGRPEADRPSLMRAAAAADCHGFVSRMALGYDSEIGENGTGLSGGERQRISIGRAILHDPKILVLDEATSSLDTEAERVIHEALGKLVEGRTTVIIAHRLVTLRGCDRILVMDRGRLAEQGTHEELMARAGGIYRGLVENQERLMRRAGRRPVPDLAGVEA